MVKIAETLETDSYLTYLWRWLAIQTERLSPWIAAAWLADIIVVGILKAYYKPLWLDEIMGVLIAKLPVRSDIWAICRSGADNQPPVYHYLMRASIQLFGNDALGMRVPSVAGYAIFCLCLYWFVSRRTLVLYGLVAMLFPCLTRCWYYATEGRPYALVLACLGIAAVCWQGLVMERRRKLMLLGLILSLACVVNLHYYAVLLFLPFAIAESVRTYQRRKIDFTVWVALTAPFLLVLIYVPEVLASRKNSGVPNAPFATPAWYGSLQSFAAEFLEPTLVAFLLLGFIYLAVQIFWRPTRAQFSEFGTASRTELIPEGSLVLSFTFFPVLAVAFSKFGTHIFFSRYSIAALFGFATVAGLGTWLAFLGRKGPALALLSVFTVLFLHTQIQDDLQQVTEERSNPPQVSIPGRIPGIVKDGNLPIAVDNLADFMELNYYGDAALRKRLFYVSSEAYAKQYLGFTFHERMMIGSAPFFGTQVVEYRTFLSQHPEFYVFGSMEFLEWLVPKLIASHVELRMLEGSSPDINFSRALLHAQVPAQ